MASGIIYDIKEFSVHDGPGTRITVFFKGCPLRCSWCHNPEGVSFEPQLIVRKTTCLNCGRCEEPCGHEMCRPFDRCIKACPLGLISVSGEKADSRTLAQKLKKNTEFLKDNGGGITISGGEPLAQPEFLLSLLEELKPMHTAIETSGYGDSDVFEKTVALSDLMLFDIKHTDSEVHKKYTGVDNRLIQKNLKHLIDSRKPFIARIPLIPGVNDTTENIEDTAILLKNADNMISLELLNYNPYTEAKYSLIDKEYQPIFNASLRPEPHEDILNEHGIRYKIL